MLGSETQSPIATSTASAAGQRGSDFGDALPEAAAVAFALIAGEQFVARPVGTCRVTCLDARRWSRARPF